MSLFYKDSDFRPELTGCCMLATGAPGKGTRGLKAAWNAAEVGTCGTLKFGPKGTFCCPRKGCGALGNVLSGSGKRLGMLKLEGWGGRPGVAMGTGPSPGTCPWGTLGNMGWP